MNLQHEDSVSSNISPVAEDVSALEILVNGSGVYYGADAMAGPAESTG
jgi:hypothetical protein